MASTGLSLSEALLALLCILAVARSFSGSCLDVLSLRQWQGLEHDGEGAASIGGYNGERRTGVQPPPGLRGRHSSETDFSGVPPGRSADAQPAKGEFYPQRTRVCAEPPEPWIFAISSRHDPEVHAVPAAYRHGLLTKVGPCTPAPRTAIKRCAARRPDEPPNLSTAGYEPPAAARTAWAAEIGASFPWLADNALATDLTSLQAGKECAALSLYQTHASYIHPFPASTPMPRTKNRKVAAEVVL